ncbi:hypothetical protein ACWDTP_16260 [Mycobacterium sp. NPDC003449]
MAVVLDAGPLNVTDQWVVLVDPAYMSEDEMAKLQALALEEQGTVNGMLIAVGDADDATANAVVAAGGGGGWGGAEFGAMLGAFGGPAAPLTVPLGAVAFGLGGSLGGARLGKFIGEYACPY